MRGSGGGGMLGERWGLVGEFMVFDCGLLVRWGWFCLRA